MIKKVLFTAMAAALVVSCGSEQKGEAAQTNGAEQAATVDEKLEEMGVAKPTEEPAASGDIVYVDMAYLSISAKLTLVEGVVLEEKLKAYEQERVNVETSLYTKEQAFAAEAAKIQEDYERTLITSITAQQKSEDLERRYAEFQATVQNEANKLMEKEQAILEEQQVLSTRFTTLLKQAVENINSDKKYKMVVTNDVVISADESLNISAIVLAEMDRLYDEGALN